MVDINNTTAQAQAAWDALMQLYGQELTRTSGYRSPQYNADVGGARNSQHTHGNAYDVDVSHLSQDERVNLIGLARQAGFGGIGIYDNSLHFDVGPQRAWGPSYSRDSIPDWASDVLGTATGSIPNIPTSPSPNALSGPAGGPPPVDQSNGDSGSDDNLSEKLAILTWLEQNQPNPVLATPQVTPMTPPVPPTPGAQATAQPYPGNPLAPPQGPAGSPAPRPAPPPPTPVLAMQSGALSGPAGGPQPPPPAGMTTLGNNPLLPAHEQAVPVPSYPAYGVPISSIMPSPAAPYKDPGVYQASVTQTPTAPRPMIPPQSDLGMASQPVAPPSQPLIPPQSGLGMPSLPPSVPALTTATAQAPQAQPPQPGMVPATVTTSGNMGDTPVADTQSGTSGGGGPLSWLRNISDDRGELLLALGTGLLSGNNWQTGLASAGQNAMLLAATRGEEERQAQAAEQERQFQLQRDQQEQAYAMERINAQNQAQSSQAYGSPFNIVGRDPTSGQEMVRAATLIDGNYMVMDDSGQWVPPNTILADWRVGNRSDTQAVTSGAGGIPNAISVNQEGMPAFEFQRESEAKNFGYAIRAIGAVNDLENIMAVVGDEGMTSLEAGLQRWAANNANETITGAVLNGIINDAGLQGAAAASSMAYLQSVLRADTGAAYTGYEVASYASAFLPSPGDSPEALEQKRLLRNRELQRFAAATGSAAPYVGGLIDGTYQLPGGYFQPSPALDQSNGGDDYSDIEAYLQEQGI